MLARSPARSTSPRAPAAPASERAELQPFGNAFAQERLEAETEEGLPSDLLAEMGESFGTDFSDVRVHEDGEAGAIGALAYARGNDLHFEPGRYDPESEAGRELIGHELAHVVQQRAGRVDEDAPLQAKGLDVQPDEGLEAEADAKGRIAARGGDARMAGSGAEGDGAEVAQCAFGLEMEMSHFYVKPDVPLPAKRDPLVNLPSRQIELEAENAGDDRNVEFVTRKGGLDDRGQLDETMRDFAMLGHQLQGIPIGGEKPTGELGTGELGGHTLLSQPFSPGAIEKEPGLQDVIEMQKGRESPLVGSMQATVGVPLEAMPKLFEAYGKMSDRSFDVPIPDEGVSEGLSPALRGMLTLLNHVVLSGAASHTAEFPKGCLAIMNRTDFHTMLHLVPEVAEADDEAAAAEGVALMLLERVQGKPDAPVFQQVFKIKDKPQRPWRITLTIEDWIMGLPKVDKLTQPPIQEDMREDLDQGAPDWVDAGTRATNIGSFAERVDDVDGRPSPVVELRTLPGTGYAKGREGAEAWIAQAYAVYDMYEDVVGHGRDDEASALARQAILDDEYGPTDHGSEPQSGKKKKSKDEKCVVM